MPALTIERQEPVEAVARAICTALGLNPEGVGEVSPKLWHEYDEAARQALAALRENISEPMKEAAAYHSLSFSNGGDDSFSFEYLSGEDAADAFRDMIDAALTDAPTKTA